MACEIFLETNNGFKMPAIGLGTWRAPELEVENAINEALEAGYRHIDCAPVYQNQSVIGGVFEYWIDQGKLTRDELFVTTKLPPNGNRAPSVEKCLRASLEDLRLDYVDLYLIHVPFALADPDAENDTIFDFNSDLVETWKVMEEMVAKGLTKFIGVSNFNERQIKRILDNCTIKPANLQIELHLYLQQPELLSFCHKNEITVTAYSPFGSLGIEKIYKAANIEKELPNIMENGKVLEIAFKYDKTPAQVLLRFLLQKKVAAIPKSTNPKRLRQNLKVFDFALNEDDMKMLEQEDCNIRVCDFTFFKGILDHPEYPF